MAVPSDLGDVVAIHLESLALSELSMRTSIDWAGANYPCTGGPEFGGKRIGEGGWRVHAKLKLVVRNEVFPDGGAIPQEKENVWYHRNASADPVKYKIDAIEQNFGAWMVLELVDPSEGG
jgi:hypothetical protein